MNRLGPALVVAPGLGASPRARLEAWAADRSHALFSASGGVLPATVSAFAKGHPAVIVAFAEAPEAFLDLTAAELAAPMTAVVGPAGAGLALLGLTEIVPAMLALDGAAPGSAAEALRLATEAGLSPVVLPRVGRRSSAPLVTARTAALCALVLSGCVEFRPVEPSALGEAETVRVTLTSRREVFVRSPHVAGDSLVGLNEATGARVAVAMAQVARLEARHVPQPDDLTGDAAEANVVTAVGASALTLAGALLILLFDLP